VHGSLPPNASSMHDPPSKTYQRLRVLVVYSRCLLRSLFLTKQVENRAKRTLLKPERDSTAADDFSRSTRCFKPIAVYTKVDDQCDKLATVGVLLTSSRPGFTVQGMGKKSAGKCLYDVVSRAIVACDYCSMLQATVAHEITP